MSLTKTETRMVEIVVPNEDENGRIADHQDQYCRAIAAMSPSRQYNADFSRSSFRRLIHGVDIRHENGWAFKGLELRAGEKATVPIGSILLVVDKSFAKANWYAGRSVKASTIEAKLYEATDQGLNVLLSSCGSKWAREFAGWLTTQRSDIPRVLVTPRSPR